MQIFSGEKYFTVKNTNSNSAINLDNINGKSLLNFLNKSIKNELIINGSEEKVLQYFNTEFQPINAGGGCVFNVQNELLIMSRRGFWDLPKGKHDDGETIEACAIREVTEETGLQYLIIKKQLPNTYHLYLQDNTWMFKTTFWYLMNVTKEQKLIPQTEEDIEDLKWVKKEDINNYLPKTFKSIQPIIIQSFES